MKFSEKERILLVFYKKFAVSEAGILFSAVKNDRKFN